MKAEILKELAIEKAAKKREKAAEQAIANAKPDSDHQVITVSIKALVEMRVWNTIQAFYGEDQAHNKKYTTVKAVKPYIDSSQRTFVQSMELELNIKQTGSFNSVWRKIAEANANQDMGIVQKVKDWFQH